MAERKVEILAVDDPRFVLLRVHQNLLILILFMVTALAGSLTYGVVQGIQDDDRQAEETRLLREEVISQKKVIDNANNIQRANTEFLRCAFLIQPDIEKTESVVDTCIDRADFPDSENRRR